MSCECYQCHQCSKYQRENGLTALYLPEEGSAVLRQLIQDQGNEIESMHRSNEMLIGKLSDSSMRIEKLERLNNKYREKIHKKEEEIDNLDRAVKAQEGIIELSLEALEELPLRYSEIKSINEKCIKFAESLQSDFCSLNK